jgi:hypothetical protein
MTTPEVALPSREVSGLIQERPTEVPLEVERVPGVQTVKTQVTAKVTDDKTGKPLIQPTPTQVTTISVPATPAQLSSWSQGSSTQSLTWFAKFWLRMVKKALNLGWKIVGKGEA